MFKPDSADSIWVPIQAVNWGFWMELTWDDTNNDWVFQQGVISNNPSGAYTTDFPEWDEIVLARPLDELLWSPVN